MNSRKLGYTIKDESFDIYIVSPQGTGPHPAILLCHAWGGRDEFMEQKAKKLAELGYVAAAIDLYGIGKRGTDRASSSALMTGLTKNPAILQERLSIAFEKIWHLDEVDKNKMGVIGYCFGGLCSILMARMGLPLQGAVSFHGLLKLGAPIDADVSAQILVLNGQDDPMVPPEDIGVFASEMKRINADWTIHNYPKTMHSFTNPKANDASFGVMYNKEADERSWKTMVRFFEDIL